MNSKKFNFSTPISCNIESPKRPTKQKHFPITLASRDYNALLPLETPYLSN